jgi:hypothetical protein
VASGSTAWCNDERGPQNLKQRLREINHRVFVTSSVMPPVVSTSRFKCTGAVSAGHDTWLRLECENDNIL